MHLIVGVIVLRSGFEALRTIALTLKWWNLYLKMSKAWQMQYSNVAFADLKSCQNCYHLKERSQIKAISVYAQGRIC